MEIPKVYVFINSDGRILSINSDVPVDIVSVDYSDMSKLSKKETLELEHRMRNVCKFSKIFYKGE